MNIITEDQLKKHVPSIFTSTAHEKMSDKYSVIPTIECVRGLQKAGFYPVLAKEQKCRIADNQPFSKHMIHFRHESSQTHNGNIPQIVMTNSHNGFSSYQIRAGMYRMVCSNGLIVGDDIFYRSVRHQGNVIEKVVQSAKEIIDITPEVVNISEKWNGIILNSEQKKIYADSALLLKWDEQENTIDSQRLLCPKRREDCSNDLWTTFNIVQENLIRGGIRYYNSSSHRRGSTRAVKSLNENSRLNVALWNLTEKMALLAKNT